MLIQSTLCSQSPGTHAPHLDSENFQGHNPTLFLDSPSIGSLSLHACLFFEIELLRDLVVCFVHSTQLLNLASAAVQEVALFENICATFSFNISTDIYLVA